MSLRPISRRVGGEEAVVTRTRGSMERSRARLKELKEDKIPTLQRALNALGTTGRIDEPERLELQQRLFELQAEQARLERELAAAKVPCGSAETVEVGSIVTFAHLPTGAEQTLTVISDNGNPTDDKTISINSPVGEHLLGKREGEEFAVVFERGEIGKGNVRRVEQYKILKIRAGEEEAE